MTEVLFAINLPVACLSIATLSKEGHSEDLKTAMEQSEEKEVRS